MMFRSFALLPAFAFAFAAAPACDSITGDDDGNNGPLTVCDYGISVKNTSGKDIGEACAANSECEFGVCMMPGDAGNLTNDKFGFCTRGCDCNDDTNSQLSEAEKLVYECLYPPGNNGSKHHVVIECVNGVSDCTDAASQWTSCASTSGTARQVCHAQ